MVSPLSYMIGLLKKGTLLFITLFFLFNTAYPFPFQQRQSPDTLLKRAKRSSEPTAGIQLAKKAILLAQDQNNTSVLVKSLNFISASYWDLRSFDSTRFYANRALSIANKYHIDSLKGDGWINLG